MEFYQKFLTKMLGEKVNTKLLALGKEKIDVTNIDTVFSNLDVLFEEVDKLEFGQPTGEKYRYLAKEDKMMVLRLISLTASIDTTAVWKTVKPDTGVEGGQEIPVIEACASLYFDRNDTKPVSVYRKTWTVEKLLGGPIANTSIEDRANAENLARGLCETRCLTKFGIGAWFGDTDPETEYAKMGNAEGSIAEISLPVAPTTAPSPVEVTESKEAEIPFETQMSFDMIVPTGNVEPKEEADVTTEPVIAETEATEPAPEAPKKRARKPKTATVTEQASEEAEDAVSTATISLSLDEARSVKATVGIAQTKGYTLGQIADDERMKRTNLKYIYAHSHSAKEKEAIRLLARNDEEIKQSFVEGGISLD